jgi:glyoxylase-like metal-dependent hydrolase (beta-lactamase superfamily II)
MKLKRYLLISGMILFLILLVAAGAIYAVLRFGVLQLQDGITLGDSVTTVVTGNFGPIPMGAYIIKLSDGSVALIDAGVDESGTAIQNALARMDKSPSDVRAIFLTHGHNDHATGALAFPAATTYVMEPDVARVKGRRGSDGRGISVRPLRDGERLDISGTAVEIFGLPGHTAGSAAILVHGVLFLGDSAAGVSEGTLQPNTMMSDDAAQTERSLLALAERLTPRRAEIRYIAFGHQGAVEGLDPLLDWARQAALR